MARAEALRNQPSEASPTAPLEQAFRPARALIGWLEADAAHQLMVTGLQDRTVSPQVVARARSARLAAGSRKRVDQTAVIGNRPTGIGEHLAQLRQNAANLFDAGWRVCTVDLSRIYALQPTTFADHAGTAANVSASDTQALAEVTLPLGTEVQMTTSFDAVQRVCGQSQAKT